MPISFGTDPNKRAMPARHSAASSSSLFCAFGRPGLLITSQHTIVPSGVIAGSNDSCSLMRWNATEGSGTKIHESSISRGASKRKNTSSRSLSTTCERMSSRRWGPRWSASIIAVGPRGIDETTASSGPIATDSVAPASLPRCSRIPATRPFSTKRPVTAVSSIQVPPSALRRMASHIWESPPRGYRKVSASNVLVSDFLPIALRMASPSGGVCTRARESRASRLAGSPQSFSATGRNMASYSGLPTRLRRSASKLSCSAVRRPGTSAAVA